MYPYLEDVVGALRTGLFDTLWFKKSCKVITAFMCNSGSAKQTYATLMAKCNSSVTTTTQSCVGVGGMFPDIFRLCNTSLLMLRHILLHFIEFL